MPRRRGNREKKTIKIIDSEKRHEHEQEKYITVEHKKQRKITIYIFFFLFCSRWWRVCIRRHIAHRLNERIKWYFFLRSFFIRSDSVAQNNKYVRWHRRSYRLNGDFFVVVVFVKAKVWLESIYDRFFINSLPLKVRKRKIKHAAQPNNTEHTSTVKMIRNKIEFTLSKR